MTTTPTARIPTLTLLIIGRAILATRAGSVDLLVVLVVEGYWWRRRMSMMLMMTMMMLLCP